jgi:hypothetical protein
MQLFLSCIAVRISILIKGRVAAQTITDVARKVQDKDIYILIADMAMGYKMQQGILVCPA